MAKPVISAAKFSAYRKSRKVYCDLLVKSRFAEKSNAENSEIERLADMIRVADCVDRRLEKPISDAIHAAEGKASARTMFAHLLARQVRELEEGLNIPKKAMDGMRVRIISEFGFRRAPRSWKYPAMATAAFLTNRRGAWQIYEIRRIDTRGIARAITVLHLPDAARDKIVEDKLLNL